MVQLSFTVFLALAIASVDAVPVTLNRRIAQVIAQSTAKWEQACLAAGGADKCNPVSVTAFTTLLANAGPCDQQNAADQMIDLAKSLNNDPTMITLTQIFVQQPRNTPNSVAIPYCQQAPQNAELNGLFQCQYQGANQKVFVNNVPVGQPGTIPFGLNAPLNPLGSCPAHTSGPIADGSQLSDIVSTPGVGQSSSSSGSNGDSGSDSGSTFVATATAAPTTVTATASSAPTSSASSSSSSGFALQNAQDAQALNAKFATLTADSSCQAGENACVNGDFAQCVNGKFVTTPCSGSLKCLALPLVNSAGTSVTCDTEADAIARIQASGGSASLTGDGSTSTSTSSGSSAVEAAAPPAESSSSSSSSSSGDDFRLQNAKDAQALNAQFASLTADSSCNPGQNACIDGDFAQCVDGKFVTSPCSATLQCLALPLVNSRGTSITCDTQADALARMQAAGASASLTG